MGPDNETNPWKHGKRLWTKIWMMCIFEFLRLLQSHWLPIRWRVQFKLCCFMHAVVTGRCPAYLGSIVQPATQSRSSLRPSSSDFSVPRTRTKFGERVFCYAGPHKRSLRGEGLAPPPKRRSTCIVKMYAKCTVCVCNTLCFWVRYLWSVMLIILSISFTECFPWATLSLCYVGAYRGVYSI